MNARAFAFAGARRCALACALACATGLGACASSAPAQPQFAPAPAPPPESAAGTRTQKRASLAGQTVLVRDLDGLALFPDEQRVAHEAIARWVENQNARVVDLSRAHEVFTRASLGQHVDTGAACGLGLSDWGAEPRYWSALGATAKLSASVGCETAAEARTRATPNAGNATPRCTLSLYAQDGPAWDGHDIGAWTAPWERDVPWQTALAHALPALTQPADDGAGGLGGLLGVGGGVVDARAESLTWGATPASALAVNPFDTIPDAIAFADAKRGRAALRSCVVDTTYGVELLVQTAADGKLTRCVSRNAESVAVQCACKAFMSGARAAKAASGTRLHLGVSFQHADVVTPNRSVVTAYANTHLEQFRDRDGQTMFRPAVSDASIREWEPPTEHALARCFAQTTELAPLQVGATVTFDAVGIAKDVQLSAKNPLGEARTACVKAALLTSRAACPARDGLTARVVVEARFATIGAPRPSLGDLLDKAAP